jgi:hypothetical protein
LKDLDKNGFHSGTDLRAPFLTPIVAHGDGKARIGRTREEVNALLANVEVKACDKAFAKKHPRHTAIFQAACGSGAFLEIEVSGIRYRYLHLSSISKDLQDGTKVRKGAPVHSRSIIALSGNSGAATFAGRHLHFEMWVRNAKYCGMKKCPREHWPVDPFDALVKELEFVIPSNNSKVKIGETVEFEVQLKDKNGTKVVSDVGRADDLFPGEPARYLCFVASSPEILRRAQPPFRENNQPCQKMPAKLSVELSGAPGPASVVVTGHYTMLSASLEHVQPPPKSDMPLLLEKLSNVHARVQLNVVSPQTQSPDTCPPLPPGWHGPIPGCDVFDCCIK